MRSDLEVELTEGAIACTAKLGVKTLRGSGTFAQDQAICTWRLPKTARGKKLSGSVAVTFQGVQAKRGFSVRVK